MHEANFDTVFDDSDDNERVPGSQGFSASMSGLNLFDIVQMECFSRAERTIRVTSGHEIGYLFFAGGALTHALTPDARGDTAALQILGWNDGSLEQCMLEPDDGSKVQLPWQELLLRAAQLADESRRNVVAFPQKRGQSGTLPKPSAPPRPPRPSETPHANRDGVIGAVRLHPSGELLSVRGESGDLPGLAAYVIRLGDLAGEALGMGRVKSVDARMERTRCVVKVESNASVTVVLASSTQSQTEPPPPATVDWNANEAEVIRLLSGLRDVEGVVGSFVVSPSGAPLGVDLPQVFDASVVADASSRVARARDSFEAKGDRLRSLEIRFAQQRLYLRCVDNGFLGLLIVGQVNGPLVSMATSVVLRKLAAPMPSATYSAPDATPVSTTNPPLGPPAASSRSPGRRLQVPGAPGAQAGRPKRPVYFRGRRVESD